MNTKKLDKRVAMFSIHSDPLAPLGSQECGGQNIYVKSLAEELAKLGWTIDIFTRWDDKRKKRVALINKNVRVIRLKGGPADYVPKQNLFDFFPEIFDDFLKFIGSKNSYDLFHGHYWDGGYMALMALRKFGKILVQNFHSVGIVRMETRKKFTDQNGESEYLIKRINIENDIVKNSSAIISLAESEKENLHRFYGCPEEKIEVIPGGVNIKHWPLIDKVRARNELKLGQNSFILLFVGRMEWRKGIGTIISAARLLKEKIKTLKILIVGGKIFGARANKSDLKEYNRLQKKSAQEEVGDIVSFVGNVDHGRLPVYYRAADAFIVPSYYEPFGLVALEGMASKIPVIASNVDGLAKIIDDRKTGLLFEPRNAFDLSQKVLDVYQSETLSAQLTENAYDKIRTSYSWTSIAKKINDLYISLLNKKIKEHENNTDRAV